MAPAVTDNQRRVASNLSTVRRYLVAQARFTVEAC